MSEETTYLFANPSFLKGASRVLDFGGTVNVYNASKDGSEADRKALENDWYAIGNDFKIALKKHEPKN